MRAARPKQPCALAGVGRRGRHSHCSSRSAARPLAAGSVLFSCRKHQESRLPWTAQNRDSSTEPASPWAPVSTSSSHCEKQTEDVFTAGAEHRTWEQAPGHGSHPQPRAVRVSNVTEKKGRSKPLSHPPALQRLPAWFSPSAASPSVPSGSRPTSNPLSLTPKNPVSLWALPWSLTSHLSHLKSHFLPLGGSPAISSVLT